MEKSVLNVEGMTCDHCKMAVTKAVKSVNGVAQAEVDLEAGTVTFDYDPAIAGLDAIKMSIVDAGYEVA
ncbi:MAG: cation transporter [Eubacteriaceae bacterium]|nr:cation transporter [Eubacteriaceae bacterium]